MKDLSTGARVRILLADDHDIIRRDLREILEQEDGWDVQAEARNGREALDLATKLRPNIAVLDLSMPELNGLEATRRIRQESSDTAVLVLTMHDGEEVVREVVAAGALGFLVKYNASVQIVAAIQSLLRRQPFLHSNMVEPTGD